MDRYNSPKGRVVLLDELRGLSVVAMVLYHAFYDLAFLFGVDIPAYHSPLVQQVAQPMIAGSLILISGISSQYSRDNLKRGKKTFLLGLLMTAATLIFMPSQAIWFGVLHLLGSSMMLFGLYKDLQQRKQGRGGGLPAFWSFCVWMLLFILTYHLPSGFFGLMCGGKGLYATLPQSWYQSLFLSIFGFCAPNFSSSDYFPLMPWVFLFFAGTSLGLMLKYHSPGSFYKKRSRFLGLVGKNALVIYLLHQPVLYALFWISFKVASIFS